MDKVNSPEISAIARELRLGRVRLNMHNRAGFARAARRAGVGNVDAFAVGRDMHILARRRTVFGHVVHEGAHVTRRLRGVHYRPFSEELAVRALERQFLRATGRSHSSAAMDFVSSLPYLLD